MTRDVGDLIRYTAIWIGLAIWIGWGWVFQLKPEGPYANAVTTAFSALMAVVLPAGLVFLAYAWVAVIRERRR